MRCAKVPKTYEMQINHHQGNRLQAAKLQLSKEHAKGRNRTPHSKYIISTNQQRKNLETGVKIKTSAYD